MTKFRTVYYQYRKILLMQTLPPSGEVMAILALKMLRISLQEEKTAWESHE